MAIAVHIYLTEDEKVRFNKQLFYRKVCGQFNPEFDIVDRVCLYVVQDIAIQEKEEKK